MAQLADLHHTCGFDAYLDQVKLPNSISKYEEETHFCLLWDDHSTFDTHLLADFHLPR